MKGYFSSLFKDFAKSFDIFFHCLFCLLWKGNVYTCRNSVMISSSNCLCGTNTENKKVSAGLCLYSFRISHHWEHLPHCPDWLFYRAFTSLCCVTSNSSNALFLESAQAYSMSHFPTLLSAVLDVCCPGLVHPEVVQPFNLKSQEEEQ